MQRPTKKELECLLRIEDVECGIPEFEEMGILDSDTPDCSGCGYLKPFGFGNGTANNYCTNPQTIKLHKEVRDKPCYHINLDGLIDQDKKRIRFLLSKMALNGTLGEEYRETKQEFIKTVLELFENGIKEDMVHELVHTYNDIRLLKEVETSKKI